MHPYRARLVYQNFDAAITQRYGVVVDGWPVGVFRCPSEVVSRVELETLLRALESNILTFTRLTPQQLERRRQELVEREALLTEVEAGAALGTASAAPSHASNATTPISPPGDNAPQPPTSSTTTDGAPQVYPDVYNPTAHASAPLSFVFSAADGQTRKRKVRADAGNKRGPNIRTTGNRAKAKKGRQNANATADPAPPVIATPPPTPTVTPPLPAAGTPPLPAAGTPPLPAAGPSMSSVA